MTRSGSSSEKSHRKREETRDERTDTVREEESDDFRWERVLRVPGFCSRSWKQASTDRLTARTDGRDDQSETAVQISYVQSKDQSKEQAKSRASLNANGICLMMRDEMCFGTTS